MLRKVKKKIEEEFNEAVNNHLKEQSNEVKEIKQKKIIAKKDKKSDKKNTIDKKVSKKNTSKK